MFQHFQNMSVEWIFVTIFLSSPQIDSLLDITNT